MTILIALVGGCTLGLIAGVLYERAEKKMKSK